MIETRYSTQLVSVEFFVCTIPIVCVFVCVNVQCMCVCASGGDEDERDGSIDR